MFFARTYVVVLLVALCGGSLPAQSRLDSIQQLSEVQVVANRYKEVIPAQKLSGIELESLSSFSAADAIRFFSGVQIKDYGGVGGLKTVDIRSMGTNHMGVFYDGIQLGNAQNGQIDLGRFSLDNMEEISLYNGQKSEIFQPAKDFGSAGTIYLRTRRPRFTGGKKTNLAAAFRTGSFHLANPSILWEQKITDNISTSFNAEYIYSSGKFKFRLRKTLPDGTATVDTTAVRQNGDINACRLEGGINGYTQRGSWNIKAYFYDSERGIPGAIVNKEEWKNPQRQWDRNFFAQGSFRHRANSWYELLVSAKYAHDYMHYMSNDTIFMWVDNTFYQNEFYASAANKFTILPSWEAVFSLDYQCNSLNADLTNFVYPRRNTLLSALASSVEINRFKAQASLLGTFVFEEINRTASGSAAAESRPDDKTEFTPAVFLSCRPFSKHDFNLRAFYKYIFRMPTFNDLYYTNIGNTALLPEYTTQYNIGFQYNKNLHHKLFKNLLIRADAYYNEVTDKIIAVPKGDSQYRWMMMNIGYVEIRGIDFSGQLSCRLPRSIGLHASVNYTFQKAQDFSSPSDNDPVFGTYGSQIAYIPRHSGSAILRADYDAWNLNYSFIYVGERYHNSSNIPANYERPWYTHDINLSKAVKLKKTTFKVAAEVNNIFNQQYDVVLNYPMPGRNYKLIIKVEAL